MPQKPDSGKIKMDKQEINTFEFLRQDVYLPGYMTLVSADYEKNVGVFEFNLKEPPVARRSIVHYLTPRGLHICISQAGYALTENMASEERLGNLDVFSLREILLQGRLKITGLNQKFRKEIGLDTLIQGKFDVTRLRLGKIPILKLDFDFGNKAIHGNLVSVIAPNPKPQLNQYALRFIN